MSRFSALMPKHFASEVTMYTAFQSVENSGHNNSYVTIRDARSGFSWPMQWGRRLCAWGSLFICSNHVFT